MYLVYWKAGWFGIRNLHTYYHQFTKLCLLLPWEFSNVLGSFFLCLFDSAVGEGRWCHLILQKMKQMCVRLNLRAWNSFVLSSARAGEDGAAQWKTPLPPQPQSGFTWTGAFSEMVLIILLSFPMDNFNKLYSWEGFSSPGSCEGGVPWGFFLLS